MVGAVELERLLNLETANRELVQRMKDDGEYIFTLSERAGRYYEHILKHKSENEHLTKKIHQLYEGAEEQKQRIKQLEEAGNEMSKWLDRNTPVTVRNDWRKAKEAKP